MSFPIWSTWQRAIYILICFFAIEHLPIALGQENSLAHPWKLLEEHRTHILQLSSDQEAEEFNQRFMPKSQRSHHRPTQPKSPRNRKESTSMTEKMRTTIATFWAAMITVAQMQALHAITEIPLSPIVLSNNFPSNAQHEWILSKPSLKAFRNFFDMQKMLDTLPHNPAILPPDNEYAQFAYFHDQASSTTDHPSWTNLFINHGFPGIQTRLHEYWKHNGQHDTPHLASDSHKQSYIQQYIVSRLLPMFRTHLLTLTMQAERQAHNVALESWHHIQQWLHQEQANRVMMRLCGTWKWMIHNHQNHGDHKSTLTFLPPGQSSSSHVQPTTILIHGDTVYLKWTFPQGIQEDSLLLSNRDRRLEGTFTNSLGPHGSISGQRLSPCKN